MGGPMPIGGGTSAVSELRQLAQIKAARPTYVPPPLHLSARNRLKSTVSDLAIASARLTDQLIDAARAQLRSIGHDIGEAASFDDLARREPDRAFRQALATPHPWRMNRLAMLDLLPKVLPSPRRELS